MSDDTLDDLDAIWTERMRHVRIAGRSSVSSLKQWREALEAAKTEEHPQYYHAEMADLLRAGETERDAARDEVATLREAIQELRLAGAEFLDASNEASKQLRTPEQMHAVMTRWQHAGVRLRQLTKSVALVRN